MDWQLIWLKIQELALKFYNFTMTQGENNFMLVNKELLYGNDVPGEAVIFFLASFVVMTLLAILASDSLHLFHPIEELKEWGSKISIIKVVIFSATVFSVHTFYKILITIIGGVISADASLRALVCLGSYINPFSVMIYAYTVSTMDFQKRNVQAAFLGWAIFLTPAAMSFYGFTNEHISIYATAGVIGLVGAILYKKCSPFITCFVLDIVYFIAKYFMIYYSDEVQLLSAQTILGRIKQYLACEQMDIIVALILLLILLGYKLATTENVKVLKDAIFAGIFAVITIVAIVFGFTELKYKPDYEQAIYLWEDEDYEEAKNAFVVLNGYEDSEDYVDKCIAKINEPKYNLAIGLIGQGEYEKAIIELNQIIDYKNSSELILECERNLQSKLAGTWHGNSGSVLNLREDGTCYYIDDFAGEGDGTWYIDDEWIIHIKSSILSYEIYASITDSFRTTSMLIESDNSSWNDEVFDKVVGVDNNHESVVKLIGTWQGEQGRVLTLEEDSTCYYVDGSSGEGPGT